MKQPDQRPWYKKPHHIALFGVFGLWVLAASASTSTSSTSQPAATVYATQPANVPLSNDNHYTNVDGNTVHSPAYSETGSVPAGATAQCRDGSYSFSQHRSGTCSHHGGVATWL
jgi:hypothetical protein